MPPRTVALITSVSGQDGAYLAELLLPRGYEVHGIKCRSSLLNTDRVDHPYQNPQMEIQRHKLHYGDLTGSSNLIRIVQETQPDELHILGAMSHVAESFDQPEYVDDGIGTMRLLKAIRILGLEKKTRFYQASTSELYGLVQEIPQKAPPPLQPRNPCAMAKMHTYGFAVKYRKACGIYACNGILFNHESPLRGETFVTRRITRAIATSLRDCPHMGNLSAPRDWGHAKDYIEMQCLLLLQRAEDLVIATDEQYSARQFVEFSAIQPGIEICYEGEDVTAKGKVGDVIVKIDPRYFHPTEGDPPKAKERLGWVPKTTLEELVAEIVQPDYKAAKRDSLVGGAGFQAYGHHE